MESLQQTVFEKVATINHLQQELERTQGALFATQEQLHRTNKKVGRLEESNKRITQVFKELSKCMDVKFAELEAKVLHRQCTHHSDADVVIQQQQQPHHQPQRQPRCQLQP